MLTLKNETLTETAISKETIKKLIIAWKEISKSNKKHEKDSYGSYSYDYTLSRPKKSDLNFIHHIIYNCIRDLPFDRGITFPKNAGKRLAHFETVRSARTIIKRYKSNYKQLNVLFGVFSDAWEEMNDSEKREFVDNVENYLVNYIDSIKNRVYN